MLSPKPLVKKITLSIGALLGFLAVSVAPVAFAADVAASSTEIKSAFAGMYSQVMSYFLDILPYLVQFLLGIALLLWLWRIITGFLHRR